MKDKEEKAKECRDQYLIEEGNATVTIDPVIYGFKAGFEAGKQEREPANQLMVETLLNIARPVAYFQRKAKKENAKVDGFYVQQLANNAHILREFAENCLKAFGIDIDAELENLSK